jgi:hypothetical protein
MARPAAWDQTTSRRRSASTKILSSLDLRLEHDGDSLPDADAHRRDAVPKTLAAKPMREHGEAPLHPIGWPNAMAPPCGLTRPGSSVGQWRRQAITADTA